MPAQQFSVAVYFHQYFDMQICQQPSHTPSYQLILWKSSYHSFACTRAFTQLSLSYLPYPDTWSGMTLPSAADNSRNGILTQYLMTYSQAHHRTQPNASWCRKIARFVEDQEDQSIKKGTHTEHVSMNMLYDCVHSTSKRISCEAWYRLGRSTNLNQETSSCPCRSCCELGFSADRTSCIAIIKSKVEANAIRALRFLEN